MVQINNNNDLDHKKKKINDLLDQFQILVKVCKKFQFQQKWMIDILVEKHLLFESG